MAVASVVIPAHNESATIGRNLAALRMGVRSEDLDVVVVCNACTDATADVARRADPRATVIEIPQPSKAAAVRVGNAATTVFPRVHMDADVELTGAAVLNLVRPIVDDHVLATAPRRALPRWECSRVVRWYFDVWEALPQVEAGIFGRGVVVLSAEAQDRVDDLPDLESHDLAVSNAFHGRECRVVGHAAAVNHPPRTFRDLVRHRARIRTANVAAVRLGVRRDGTHTTVRMLLALAVARPGFALRLPVFLAVHVAARLAAASPTVLARIRRHHATDLPG